MCSWMRYQSFLMVLRLLEMPTNPGREPGK